MRPLCVGHRPVRSGQGEPPGSQAPAVIARRRLPLFVACAVLAAVAAYVGSSFIPKTFEAKATLIVGQSLSAANPDYTQLLVSERLAATYAEVVTTQPILAQVVSDLALATTTEELAARVRADASPDSTILIITAQDSDPGRAAAIANALADDLIAASPTIQGRDSDIQKAVDANLASLQQEIESAQAEIARLTALESPTPSQTTRTDTLQSRLITLRSTYAGFLAYSSSSFANRLNVIEPAAAPIGPVSPRPFLDAVLAAFLAIVLSVGAVFVLELLDDSIKDHATVEAVTSLATLGSIPAMRVDRNRDETYRLVTLLYPRSRAAEAYRSLRTNLEFASPDAPLRTILITSAGPGEGKTVTAANLAVVFAQTDKRVLLVDADLRKPGVHKLFNLPNWGGVTAVLRSADAKLDAALRTEVPNLRVLTSGILPANPAELLASQKMRDVVQRLAAEVDVVVVDSPPLAAVTDSVILSSLADGTVLVIDAGRSRRRLVAQANEALTRAGAHVLGALLNQIPAGAEDAYGGAYGYYDEDSARTTVVDADTVARQTTP